ncbi:MAG: hypothetical protein JST11_11750 [Acidobacteria bacterium]|nr:hypothetical protein [Acidobacteriota bacterium]
MGVGLRPVYKNSPTTCSCVFRAIFRACLNRFRECAAYEGLSGSVSWEYFGSQGRRTSYSRKREEYMADFCLISRRVLEPAEHRLFRFYYLLGADWKLCARRFKTDRSVLFRSLARIERRLGRAFAETVPYSIFPLDEYFGGVARDAGTTPASPVRPRNRARLDPPIRRAA